MKTLTISNMRFSLLLCFFLLPSLAVAQDFFNFLSPHSPSTSIELEGSFIPTRDAEHGKDETQVLNTAASINQKVYEGSKNMVTVGVKTQKLGLTGESSLLRNYYNNQLSVGFKRTLPEEKFWLATVSYGSASDRPLDRERDNTLSLNYIQKVSDRWYVAGNYSNNRTFLNNVPLPGFFYVKEMTREKTFVIGFPFLFWRRPLSENWAINYLGIMPWTHHLKFLYMKWRFIRPYFGFSQNPVSYFRHDRTDKQDRIFWFERRLNLGVEANLGKTTRVDLSGGLAFDREVYEAENFGSKKNFLVNIDNGYYLALNLRFNF